VFQQGLCHVVQSSSMALYIFNNCSSPISTHIAIIMLCLIWAVRPSGELEQGASVAAGRVRMSV
jgi:hypothetical protein